MSLMIAILISFTIGVILGAIGIVVLIRDSKEDF
jgi:hypothetical protein